MRSHAAIVVWGFFVDNRLTENLKMGISKREGGEYSYVVHTGLAV